MRENNMTGEDLKINTLEVTMKQVQTDIKEIKSLLLSMEDKFVTRKEFGPVQRIVYGMVGTVLTTVLAGLLYLVIAH